MVKLASTVGGLRGRKQCCYPNPLAGRCPPGLKLFSGCNPQTGGGGDWVRRYSLLQPACVGAAQEWRIGNQGVGPRRNLRAASGPKAKLRSLLIRELAHLLPHPYWQTRLTSPFSKGETGLGTLATFFPPHSCPSHELRGSVDVKASHRKVLPGPFDTGMAWVGSGPRQNTEPAGARQSLVEAASHPSPAYFAVGCDPSWWLSLLPPWGG